MSHVAGVLPSLHEMLPTEVFLVIAAFTLYTCFNWPVVRSLLNKYARNGNPVVLASQSAKAVTLERRPGTWQPVDYKYPLITPVRDDPLQTKPSQFFIWKWRYFTSMNLRTMPTDEWLQLDSDYMFIYNKTKKRTAEMGPLVTASNPKYMREINEVLQETCSYLAHRYPLQFTVSRVRYDPKDEWTWGDSISGKEAGAVSVISNQITGDVFDLVAIRKEEGEHFNPMRIAGLLAQDEFLVMIEHEDGMYYLEGGSMCTAGSWRFSDKLHKDLSTIHLSGHVPHYADKLRKPMEAFFTKLKVDKPVLRTNFYFQLEDENYLEWFSSNGPEDVFNQDQHAPFPDKLASSSNPDWKHPGPLKDDHGFRQMIIRNENQSLRRMPRFGAILFTVKHYWTKMTDIAQEPSVPGRLASNIRTWDEQTRRGKGADNWTEYVLPILDSWHAKQINNGLIRVDANGKTLDET